MNRRDFTRLLGAGALLSALPEMAYALPAEKKPPMQHDMKMKHDMTGYGIPSGPPQQFAMLVYPRTTALDLMGPLQMFASLGNTKIHLVLKNTRPLVTDSGLTLVPNMTFADCPDNLTVLFAPGGLEGTIAAMNDDAVLDFLAHRGKTAQYVTSVCTGSLLLGAAGLLRGRKATSHWSVRDLLTEFGAMPVASRVVEDGNRITGAGVTAGLDFGLLLTERLRNEKMARAMQLVLEYDPQPPFHAGRPETAGADVLGMERAMYAPGREAMQAAARRARKRFA